MHICIQCETPCLDNIHLLVQSPTLVVYVGMMEEQYTVGESDGLKEVCVQMEGRAVDEVTVHLSSVDDTAKGWSRVYLSPKLWLFAACLVTTSSLIELCLCTLHIF